MLWQGSYSHDRMKFEGFSLCKMCCFRGFFLENLHEFEGHCLSDLCINKMVFMLLDKIITSFKYILKYSIQGANHGQTNLFKYVAMVILHPKIPHYNHIHVYETMLTTVTKQRYHLT